MEENKNNPWSFENFKKRLEKKKDQKQNFHKKKNKNNKKKPFFNNKRKNYSTKNYVQYNDNKELETRNKNIFLNIFKKLESHYEEQIDDKNICPICNKEITNFYESHKHKETGKLAHLTCIINEIKKKEQLRTQETICYMGNSTFVICTLPENKTKFFIRKRIVYMENKNIFNKNKDNNENE